MTRSAAPLAPVRHFATPHLVGYIYDCPGCLTECRCQTGQGPCAHCVKETVRHLTHAR